MARDVAGRREECPLCDPEPELREEGNWRSRAKKIGGIEKIEHTNEQT